MADTNKVSKKELTFFDQILHNTSGDFLTGVSKEITLPLKQSGSEHARWRIAILRKWLKSWGDEARAKELRHRLQQIKSTTTHHL